MSVGGALLALGPATAHSQILFEPTPAAITVEAYGNITTGVTEGGTNASGQAPDPVRFDGAARILGRVHAANGLDFGARVVVEGSNDSLRIGEASVLLFGSAGRLEIGKQMGLPDVLSGYAPNSFTFTAAEFGPPTGRTLDPGGGLQTQFLRSAARSRLESLAGQGVTAAQFDDQSPKLLYVSPKHNGWLAGASFSPDADDPGLERLAQFGVVHESYREQDIWRWGGSYAHARSVQPGGASVRALNSISLGSSVTLNDSLDLGIAASYDGMSGAPVAAQGELASPTWGMTASVNYNTGPWTVGAYYQYAKARIDKAAAGADRLAAFELGASYRVTTKVRIYGAGYRYDLATEFPSTHYPSAKGNVFTLGLRAAL